MTSDEVNVALLEHDSDLKIFGEFLGAMLLAHPNPRLVLSNFRQRIASMAGDAPPDTHPADVKRLLERAELHLKMFELTIGSSEP